MDNMVLNNIKRLRWELELSTRDVADRAGHKLRQGTVSKVENGETIPNQKTMMLISKGLGKPMNEVFYDWTDVDIDSILD